MRTAGGTWPPRRMGRDGFVCRHWQPYQSGELVPTADIPPGRPPIPDDPVCRGPSGSQVAGIIGGVLKVIGQ